MGVSSMSQKEYIKALSKLFELANEWNKLLDDNPDFFPDYHIIPLGIPGTPFVDAWEFGKPTE